MNDEDNWTNRVIRGILNDLRMIEKENEYKTNNHIKELKVKRLIWICWMKSRTESRYWNEFYHYEQWLIDNGLLSSSKCYSLTDQMWWILDWIEWIYWNDEEEIQEEYNEIQSV